MSHRSQFCLAVSPAIALAFAVSVAAAPPVTAPAGAKPGSEAARLATYEKSAGERYFALALMPKISVEPATAHDVVVLVDTSASQTRVYREHSFEALKSLLSGLAAGDRVKLFAVDVNAVPLTDSFISPTGAEAAAALEKLHRRVPLGSTDMGAALQAALDSFSAKSASARAVVFIGDGLSKASLLSPSELDELMKNLVARRAPVTSFAIGPQRDVQLLATLANHTGGMVLVDDDKLSPGAAGQRLVKFVHGPVLWPTSVKFSSALVEVYPKTAPPLRTDRDSVMIGTINAGGTQQIAMTAEVQGKTVELSWKVQAESSSDDFAFLPKMTEMVRKDGGISMPTAGSAALAEVSRVMLAGAQGFSKLGSQALATGDREGAKRLAEAALKLDPASTTATAIRRAADKAKPSSTAPSQKGAPEKAKPAAPKTDEGAALLPEGLYSAVSFGGGGGGFGGGFMAVEDDLKLGVKKPASAPKVEKPAVERPAGQKPAVQRPAVVKPATGATAFASEKARRFQLSAEQNGSDEEAWTRYFAAQVEADKPELPASIRLTIRELMYEKKYEDVIALLHGALRGGQPHPWMYETLALAVQARHLNDPDQGKAELERTLLSAVDFSESLDDMMFVSLYMTRLGLDERALKLFQKLSLANPGRPEPYLQGLEAAKRLDDIKGIQWACAGILSQAWPKDQRKIFENALRVADATHLRLTMEQRLDDAKQFKAAMDQALVRDCFVIVTWTGDADVDVFVEEPTGTVCSFRNPRSAGGGVMMGDTFARPGKATTEGYKEVYACSKGFSGEYKVLLKRVWGKVTAGKVTVDVYTNYRTEQEKRQRQQIAVTDNALVIFDLKSGRRTEPLEDLQAVAAAENQVAISRAILTQQLSAAERSQATSDYGKSLTARGPAAGGVGPRGRLGAVGFRPVITTLPEGANMTATGVVSADRRYVRITATPLFSQIGTVTTFNFATGGAGAGQAGGGGQGMNVGGGVLGGGGMNVGGGVLGGGT